ncbi:MAG: alpha/beta hydrolase [Anaerolineae bacterium]
MKSKTLSLCMGMALLLSLVAACGAGPTPTSPPPTDVVQAATDTPLPPTHTPEPTEAPTPLPIPVFEEAACPFELPPGQVDGRTVECGYLEVSEDRADPSSATLRLAVAIFRHPDGDPEPDPVIYLEGGPGGSALEFASLSFDDLSAPVFAANRDLILFDQRGVGLSEPALDCPELVELGIELLDNEIDGRVLTYPEMDDLYLETALSCGTDLQQIANLADYNSVENAADVEDLRRALGYDQVNLWGISYGTRLALEVMRDYPDGARSVVLDSVFPPDVDSEAEGPANISRALEVLFAGCQADAACSAAYPDLRDVLFDTVDRLNETPADFTVVNPLTGEEYDAVMNGDDMLGLIAQSLYQTSVIPLLPKIIYDASAGGYDLIGRIAGVLLATQEGMSDGMHFSVQCNEEIPFSSEAAFEAALADYPELDGLFPEIGGEPMSYALCAGWHSGQAGPSADEPVTSDIPTLVMSGEYDPVTPPDWGRQAASTLSSSFFFEYPGLGHGTSPGTGCPSEMMTGFLDDPGAVPDDACIAEMGPPAFVVPTEAGAVALEPFIDEELDIAGVVPTGWTNQSNGVYTRGSSDLDATVLIEQGGPLSAEEILGLYVELLELGDVPESVGGREANGLTWSLYELEYQDLPANIALTEQYGQALIVFLVSEPGERETMLESVFFPAVDALVPLGQPAAHMANAFMVALKDADYERVFELCDPGLQDELGSAADLEEWMLSNGIELLEWSLPQRDLVGDTVEVLGTATLAGDQQASIEIVLLQVDGEWRVAGFHFL